MPDRLRQLERENADLRDRLEAALHAQSGNDVQRLATLELKHRTKNILAVIQSLINQTLRADADIQDARHRLEERVSAMGRAIDVLLRTDWQATELRDVVSTALVHDKQFGDRVRITLPELQLSPDATLTLTMALHELESNAMKYGALSNDDGVVSISGEIRNGDLILQWREQSGPPVSVPSATGFGTRLIRIAPARRFGATADLSYASEGVEWRFQAPLSALIPE